MKIVFACILVGALGVYGFAYAKSHHYLAPRLLSPTQSQAPTTENIALSTTTPQRIINKLTIEDTVPTSGKFIAADLVHMQLYLYQDGATVGTYPILTKGRPRTPYETPSGFYSVLTKEKNHFNSGEKVNMPYSMEFYGNYFIHGWPTYQNGTPVASTYSGGCIRLSTDDAALVYAFADRGVGVFVYDTGSAATTSASLTLNPAMLPKISAASYLVADIDTGDVYAEQNASQPHAIASVTKLMTALVANETIMFDRKIEVPRDRLAHATTTEDSSPTTFVVGDLLYPLLMESNNKIADTLAGYYGKGAFVSWMNAQAKALGMTNTIFADASGVSADNISTPEDLYRLAVYLANKKSFVWNITRTPNKTITAGDGSTYSFNNFNQFSNLSSFVGGKVGHTTVAQDTMVSVFSLPVNQEVRRVAVVVLNSQDYTDDTKKLAEWFAQSASNTTNTACASCAQPETYKKIEL